MLKFLTVLFAVVLCAASAGASEPTTSENVDPPDCEGNVCTICNPEGDCTIIIVNTPPYSG